MRDVDSAIAEVAPFEVRLGDKNTEFSGSVRMISEVALSFGVVLTEQERRDWQTLGRASYIIDQYLDAEKNTPMPDIAAELFSDRSIPGIPEEFRNDCRDWLERQSEERQHEINSQLAEVRLLVEAQAAATSVAEVVRIRRREAELLANILSLSPEDRSDVVAREKFNTWLKVGMRTGYLLDSLLDIKEDYESGGSALKPGVVTSSKMVAYLLRETVAAACVSPRALGKGALIMARYSIKKIKPDFSNPETVI